MLELEDFNKDWDDKFKFFNEKSKQIEEIINKRHQKEIQDLQNEMDNYTPKIKPNHQYNQLKMTEIRLKKMDKFLDADKLKLKCEQLEKLEIEKLNKEKNDKFKLKAERLEKKQLNELEIAKKKLQDEYNIISVQREKEYDTLMIRFKTRKIELDLQQKQEKNTNTNLNKMKLSKLYSIILYFVFCLLAGLFIYLYTYLCRIYCSKEYQW